MAGTRSNGAGKAAAQVPEQKAPRGQRDSHRDQAAPPRSLAISQRGVKTGEDFANLMSALMADVIDGSMSPMIANATVNAGGKLLKVVEMQYRYGKEAQSKTLLLATGD